MLLVALFTLHLLRKRQNLYFVCNYVQNSSPKRQAPVALGWLQPSGLSVEDVRSTQCSGA